VVWCGVVRCGAVRRGAVRRGAVPRPLLCQLPRPISQLEPPIELPKGTPRYFDKAAGRGGGEGEAAEEGGTIS